MSGKPPGEARPVPSLFKRSEPAKDLEPALRAFFAGHRQVSPQEALLKKLEVMTSDADVAHAEAELKRGDYAMRGEEYAQLIEFHIKMLERAREAGDAVAVANEAILLTQAWMQLRMDWAFGYDIQAKRNSNKREPSVSIEQIRSVLRACTSMSEAEATLGIGRKQIGRRMNDEGLQVEFEEAKARFR